MVDDFQNLGFFKAGHRLGNFIVVNQHHPFPAGTQQMITGEHAHNLLGFVQDGVTVLPVFQHLLPHLIHPVFQMEAHQILPAADAPNGSGLENQPGGGVSIKGSGDNAGGGGKIAQFLLQLRLAQHQAVDPQLQCAANHIRLVAAQHYRLWGGEQQILPALGQGNGHLTANGIRVFTGGVEDLSFQHG